jgi:hypothetical protein
MEKRTYTVSLRNLGEKSLAIVAERGVTNVMSKGYGLNEVLIESQETPHSPGYLGDKLNVQDAMGDMIILDEIKHLSFIHVARIGERMENPIRIQCEILPMAHENLLFLFPPHCLPTQAGMGRESFLFTPIQIELYFF